MREVFSKTVKDDRVSVSEGFFHETGVEDGWADLVVIAQVRNLRIYVDFASLAIQAFHWCPDYDAASAEFDRVLKSSGTLAFIWNLEDRWAPEIQHF